MTAHDDWPDDLEEAVTTVYRGPLEEFIARRDALVKELRGAGRADEAKQVKALRKPSRMAWALDAAVHDDPAPVERLASTVAALVETQADGGGDVRQATERLRTAARHLASAAGRAATGAGHRIDQSTLVPAVLAVVGEPEAFEALRRGRLADVPAGGGLDVLSLTPPRAAPLPADEETGPEPADPQAVVRAREALERAEAAAETAREEAERAEQAVDDAEAELDAADERLRQAEQDARRARADLRQAQQDARAARRTARDADAKAAEARRRLRHLDA